MKSNETKEPHNIYLTLKLRQSLLMYQGLKALYGNFYLSSDKYDKESTVYSIIVTPENFPVLHNDVTEHINV